MTINSPEFLFIHGAGGTSSKWRKQKERLELVSARYIDLPGHGNNKAAIPVTIESYAEWINQTLEDDVIVVGHSMGGLIGLELAARSQRVKGLILVASHYRLPVHPKILQQLSEGILPDSFFYASYAGDVDPMLIEEEKKERNMVPVNVVKADLKACDQYQRGKSVVQSVEIPILAIYGEEDKLLPKDAMEKLIALNDSIKAIVLEGAGHYVMLENADTFTDEILRFRQEVE
ncbi:pimeloyl-ACP methyl ester carboxylesterase [Caldalkalibacillus uzonensis]|uniref:Pimeloyl-ACP methyl ester carboxylesterase n=1 Tax=Caldalkalibacillus uzonensis TaxID=353224 RepID=A0ABU0CV35_9BACI|nr:alpha/beta hydrolase [Caldalkalibacillus uzonensis]MDQ0338897.1 pimeloyl-ACP methyl ester carboxylesterase [Caldalkalibacillus uzonensis]